MKIFIGGISAGKTGAVMTGTVTTPTRGQTGAVMTGAVTTPTRRPTRGLTRGSTRGATTIHLACDSRF